MENQSTAPANAPATSSKSRLALTLLAFFLGQIGAHRFYAGKTGTGIIMLVICILGYATVFFIWGIPLFILGVWVLIDFIMAVAGKFRDSHGNLITTW